MLCEIREVDEATIVEIIKIIDKSTKWLYITITIVWLSKLGPVSVILV